MGWRGCEAVYMIYIDLISWHSFSISLCFMLCEEYLLYVGKSIAKKVKKWYDKNGIFVLGIKKLRNREGLGRTG